MVVTRDHVLGAEVGEGQQVCARDLLDVALVAFRNCVSKRRTGSRQHGQNDGDSKRQPPPVFR